MSIENYNNLFITYIITRIIVVTIKHILYISCLLFIRFFMNDSVPTDNSVDIYRI